jgi:hypothetical protein
LNSMMVCAIAFVTVFGAALLGMVLRTVLPEHHLNAEARDVVKLGMGLVATMAALVLSLVLASAKNLHDTRNDEITQTAADVLALDRTLAHYGPETKEARDLLRQAIAYRIAVAWPESASGAVRLDTPEAAPKVEGIEERIRALSPTNETQHSLQTRALQLVGDVQRTRWLLFGTADSAIPTPFLVILVSWLTILFASFGLLAPRNGTVLTVLFVCAASVAGAIFLIIELERPLNGLLKVSGAPLRYTLAHLGP